MYWFWCNKSKVVRILEEWKINVNHRSFTQGLILNLINKEYAYAGLNNLIKQY